MSDIILSSDNLDKRLAERGRKHALLLKNIKNNLEDLEELFKSSEGHSYEDMIYRYYHTSYKVYYINVMTMKIVKALKELSPCEDKRNIDEDFKHILIDALKNRHWKREHNEQKKWREVNGPKIEAFFHAKYFLSMAIKAGKEYEEPPYPLPSGWACLLYFYKIR